MSGGRVEAVASAMASLPAMTPQRLHKLAESTRRSTADSAEIDRPVPPAEWEQLWELLLRGESMGVRLARVALGEQGSGRASDAARSLARRWSAGARELEAHLAEGPVPGPPVLVRGLPGYPVALLGDQEAPEVLFSAGTVFDPGPHAVAVIGTRAATYYGTEVAAEIGAELARSGVTVVSGLASGIDAAAHEGALTCFDSSAGAPVASGCGRPIGILGAGVDVVYPRSTARLRTRVESAGMVLSEAPAGSAADGWRFPLRNRIIAGLVSLVVVVESHKSGGSLHTVEAALRRQKVVMAVPGSIRSPASAGTNMLLSNGAHPVTDPTDVLVALELLGVPVLAGARRRRGDGDGDGDGAPGPAAECEEAAATNLDAGDQVILKALDLTPTPTTAILSRTGRSLESVSMALERLAEAGLVRDLGGAWARLAPPSRSAAR